MTVKDQVFLYCFLLYEGENQQILNLLSEERARLIQKEARRYDRFPKEVRMTLVSKLLGYLVQHVRNRNLERIHPSWIAYSIEKESPKVRSILLNRLSPEYRKEVEELIKSPSISFPIPQQSSDAIFQIFAMRFAPMSSPWGETQLSLQTLFLLKHEEMFTFLKHIGVREIARASSIAGKNALAALVIRFPQSLQEDFLNELKSVQGDAGDKVKLATKRLSHIDLASMPMEDATLKVGLTKLGASLKNEKEAATKIAQRLPRSLGMVVLEAMKEMEAGPEEQQELSFILRDLIDKGKIDRQQVESLFSSISRVRPSGIS
jgi:hypothetical protein